jgi:hypothetical protein
MVHAVWRFDYVWASAPTTTVVQWAASLAVLVESLLGGLPFLWGCPEFFPNSPEVHSRQNQCYALAWGSYAGFCCSEVLGPCLALKLSSTGQVCKNAESRTC